jgi:hypothetical protein
MLVSKHADTGWSTIEKSSGCRRKPEPASRDHANDVTAGKCQSISLDFTNKMNKSIGSGRDLVYRFSLGATIAVELPSRVVLKNLVCRFSFKYAVIPFEKIKVDFCSIPKPG